ncbi:MauE/DoxX family redox-associated membrane protein [Nonomuraea sp. NPDC049684]|uniref:MauE/DoxX family redox-associated membrane protein n=1 Tax=Nonomuraea sp. NPDC049684 TaxID=3364356 RepID=UPI0037A51EE7
MGLPEICLFCRVLIGVVFAVAALGKLRGAAARRAFADSLVPVLSAAGIGRRARHPVAAALITAEAAIPAALLFPSGVTAGFMAADALLVVLGGGLAVALRAGVQAECHCFGARAGSPLAARHLVRTGVLLVVAVTGTAASWAAPVTPGAAPAVAAAGAAVVGAVVLIALDDILALFAPIGP